MPLYQHRSSLLHMDAPSYRSRAIHGRRGGAGLHHCPSRWRHGHAGVPRVSWGQLAWRRSGDSQGLSLLLEQLLQVAALPVPHQLAGRLAVSGCGVTGHAAAVVRDAR